MGKTKDAWGRRSRCKRHHPLPRERGAEGGPQGDRECRKARDPLALLPLSRGDERRRGAYGAALQVELVKMSWALKDAESGSSLSRPTRQGKGGTIERVRENPSTRARPIVALPKPTDREARNGISAALCRLVAGGGRDRAGPPRVQPRRGRACPSGFLHAREREHFFRQLPGFEKMLTLDEGIVLVKLWLSVDRAEQLKRFDLRRDRSGSSRS